ncbi:TrmB family transcriptional regulator [Alkalihalobacillus trypoxylicola]|uniref:Transcriptional regulator n=1 Tax=Alkalihalobacillus trypoxylicola TaxID=519424 RepID=A0A162DEM1_9BACI|nr:helix-turn-helix domain-containing protein [Alkalihalobacillus trypoxylicola]KYG29395.1 transcriptional regulator [Alkalihalobacillus trypoxylicola]GAF64493.1 putative transcriptional regulator [Bacillus sp. TS-2]
MEEVYKELQKLGFSKYECKAYISLLRHSPITGYEISKRSGVPRSMIYEVVGKLVDKGAVYTVPSDPVTYAPLPAKELLSRLRQNFEDSFDFLENKLASLESEQEVDVIRRISTDEHVLAEMLDMVTKAKNELWLSIWSPQVSSIIEDVRARINQDHLEVYSLIFGAPDTEIGVTTHHDYMEPKIAEERMSGRLTIIARDLEEVLIANFAPDTSAWAIKTKDPALILVAMEYIRHDMMYSRLTETVGPEKAASLWKDNADLYHVVTGKRFI